MQEAKIDYNLRCLCFKPLNGKTKIEQLADCYSQLNKYAQNNHFSINTIVKQSIFISIQNDADYYKNKKDLLTTAQKFFSKVPPSTILAQTPANTSLILEIFYLEGIDSRELHLKKNNNNSWIVFQRDDFKMVFATVASDNQITDNKLQQNISSFEQLKEILEAEEMDFSDIIRQWNYIEQITGNSNIKNQESQHYQIFNDVRSQYYNHSNFKNGYPAATGIGIFSGGIILDIIAVKTDNKHSIVAIKSPLQVDAHTYTTEVLCKNYFTSIKTHTTPKFERAKAFIMPKKSLIFISGTAAIKGQNSLALSNIDRQTECTIESIRCLISNYNLEKYGIRKLENTTLTYLRVYLKFPNDIERVKDICEKHFSNIPITYVVADVCRSELLVEMEGYSTVNS